MHKEGLVTGMTFGCLQTLPCWEDAQLVMHMGVPWGFFCSPAPAPTGNLSRDDGCGIPQLTLKGLYYINYINYIK